MIIISQRSWIKILSTGSGTLYCLLCMRIQLLEHPVIVRLLNVCKPRFPFSETVIEKTQKTSRPPCHQPPLKCMCVIVCVCVCLHAYPAKPSQFLFLDTETLCPIIPIKATHFVGLLCVVRYWGRDSCWTALLQSTGLSYFQVQTASLFPFARTFAHL